MFVIIGIFLLISKILYEKSDYYKQTRNGFLSVQFDKGIKGEFLIWKYLRNLSGYKKYLFNCYLPKDNGETTELDVILLHESGIYVFESKNFSGWIFGTETQQYWTQTLPKGRGKSQKERFFNPIIQNKVHLKWLSKYLNKECNQFYSYIVFSNRCTLKDITLTSGQHHVINRYNILQSVRENVQEAGQKLTSEEIDQIYTNLQPLTQMSEAQKLAHIENVQKKKELKNTCNREPQGGEIFCPRCGGKLVLRTATKGANAGGKFWGCSNYPKCNYIKNIESL